MREFSHTDSDSAKRLEKAQTRYLTSAFLFMVAVGVMVLMGVGAVAWQVFELRNIADTNRALNTQNRQVIETIESCTTPKGECARRSASRTGDVASAIIVCTKRVDVVTKEDALACMAEVATQNTENLNE